LLMGQSRVLRIEKVQKAVATTAGPNRSVPWR
jgi:hypothetical protein